MFLRAMVRIFSFGERWNVPVNSVKWNSISISRNRNRQLNRDNFTNCYIIVFVVVG